VSGVRWSATELMATTFPPPRWAVPGVVPEGLTLLAAAPKFGKSWWALNLGIAVASGSKAFGKVSVVEGDVLILALEDTARRLQDRLTRVLQTDAPPHRLDIWTAFETDDCLLEVETWLHEHGDARLVVVDVLRKVRPMMFRGESSYDADYRALEPWKELADRYGVAIVVLHHVRKAGGEDFVDQVSGTHGLAGSADTIAVMTRARNTTAAVLKITGRDVDEAEHAFEFDAATCSWLMLDGPAVMHTLGDTKRRILDALTTHGATSPKALAELTELDYELVKKTVQRMHEDGLLSSPTRGVYVPYVPLSLTDSDLRDIGTEGTGDTGGTA
jgi:RecA-family ATPase